MEAVPDSTIVHTPVLLEETIGHLAPAGAGCWMIDASLGEGGHSEAFLSRFPDLRITGIDADSGILAAARIRLGRFGGRVEFYAGWAEDFFNRLRDTLDESPPHSGEENDGVLPPEARAARPGVPARQPRVILMDLGVSLYHYEKGDRGFSFRKDEPLDMRIDRGRGRSAAHLIASLREDELAALLWQNAEERYSRRIAAAIIRARHDAAIERSGALADIVRQAVPPEYRRGAFHPATKTFQALRIAVNGELETLEGRLESAFSVLAAGGRLGVISFHSGEDRIVKRFFRAKAARCVCPPDMPICRCGGIPRARLVTGKPVCPRAEEARVNPPSRSAKLRVLEKTG